MGSSLAVYHPRWSSYRDMMPTYNQLAATSLLNQQYNAALGLGIIGFFYLYFSHLLEMYAIIGAVSHMYQQLIKPHHVCSCCLCTRTPWHPSQKSSHGGAGCSDRAFGWGGPEKGKGFYPATGQTACSTNTVLCPGSEGERTHQ